MITKKYQLFKCVLVLLNDKLLLLFGNIRKDIDGTPRLLRKGRKGREGSGHTWWVIVAGEEVAKWGGVRPAIGGGTRVPRWGARVRRQIFRCIGSLPGDEQPLDCINHLVCALDKKTT